MLLSTLAFLAGCSKHQPAADVAPVRQDQASQQSASYQLTPRGELYETHDLMRLSYRIS